MTQPSNNSPSEARGVTSVLNDQVERRLREIAHSLTIRREQWDGCKTMLTKQTLTATERAEITARIDEICREMVELGEEYHRLRKEQCK